jgi:hypothetical protein
MSVEPLAGKQLARRYAEMRASGVFGPGVHLYAMQRDALKMVATLEGEQRVAGFVLANVLELVARRQDEEVVEFDPGADLLAKLDAPVAACIAAINGAADGAAAADRLIAAYLSIKDLLG